MTFRFIHTSDWHIAKPFRRFEPALAGELAAARLGIIARIADIARRQGAQHVVVAGDIFDSELIATIDIRRALARLAEQSDLTWLLMPGNHDPARISGVWDQVARIGAPANVVVLDRAVPHALGREAVLLPSPLTSKDPGRDITDWMDTAVTPPGVARIGLAHGSVRGFGSDDTAALRLAPDRAKRAGLSYLALGDWHGVESVAQNTWYSGTPEPDQYPDNEPGYVLSVVLEEAKLATVEKLRSSEFTWVGMDRAIHSVADLATVERDLEASALSLGKTLVHLTLRGHLSLTERAGAPILARSLGCAAAFPRSRRQGVGGESGSGGFRSSRPHRAAFGSGAPACRDRLRCGQSTTGSRCDGAAASRRICRRSATRGKTVKLLALRVAAFRRFAQPAAVEGFGDGINVLAGPNEMGKSTLFRALEAAFLTRYKVTGAALDDMRPHAGGEPLVEAEFEAQGRRWSIRKQFGRGASAVLTDVSSRQRRRAQRRS